MTKAVSENFQKARRRAGLANLHNALKNPFFHSRLIALPDPLHVSNENRRYTHDISRYYSKVWLVVSLSLCQPLHSLV